MRRIEKYFEQALFAARWLAAPIYVGLIFCLIVLLVVLVRSLIQVGAALPTISVHDAVVATLSVIDLALIANLILIVLYTGYVSFVSRLSIEEHEDRPAWLGKVDFAGLKLKLFASIVAITGIELLKAFMDLRETGTANGEALRYLVIIHAVFLVTALASAVTQWLSARAEGGMPG
jgi:uncharacterized protein (TIGR00645 family)